MNIKRIKFFKRYDRDLCRKFANPQKQPHPLSINDIKRIVN